MPATTAATASTAVIGTITVADNTDVLIDVTTDVTGDQVPDGFMNFRTQWELTLAQNATNLINNNHTFTATLTKSTNGGTTFAPASGQALSFSETGPGTFVPNVANPTCTTSGSGQCPVTITSSTTGLTTVTATFNEPGITVTTPVTLDAPATKQWVNYLLSIDGNSVNPVGNPHTFTLTLQKDTGSGFAPVGAGEIIALATTGTRAITGISPVGTPNPYTTPPAHQCTT